MDSSNGFFIVDTDYYYHSSPTGTDYYSPTGPDSPLGDVDDHDHHQQQQQQHHHQPPLSSSPPHSSASSSWLGCDYQTISSAPPKRRAGRTKFRETRHPVYKGVRRRNADKWVCEVREPNKKSRIWLGTFPTAEMAARAHDVAAITLRGRAATLNFADSPWLLPAPKSASPKDIQRAAAEAAEAFRPAGVPPMAVGSGGEDDDNDHDHHDDNDNHQNRRQHQQQLIHDTVDTASAVSSGLHAATAEPTAYDFNGFCDWYPESYHSTTAAAGLLSPPRWPLQGMEWSWSGSDTGTSFCSWDDAADASNCVAGDVQLWAHSL